MIYHLCASKKPSSIESAQRYYIIELIAEHILWTAFGWVDYFIGQMHWKYYILKLVGKKEWQEFSAGFITEMKLTKWEPVNIEHWKSS